MFLLATIQQMIDCINNNRSNGIPFNEIEKILKENFIFTELKLNHKFLLLENNEIDFSKSAYVNLTNIYNKKKNFSVKKNRAIEISKNIKDIEPTEKKEKLIVDRKYAKFENFWWFIKDGFTILCGKSADDNETILNNIESSI